MNEQLPQAGWYANAEGRTQWWDGTAWGQLAPEAPVAAEPVAAAPTAPDASDAPDAPAQPRVAQEFSHEFLEREYGSARLPETKSELSDPIAQWAQPTTPAVSRPAPARPAAPASAAPAAPAAPAPIAPAPAAPFPAPARPTAGQSHYPPPPANYPPPGQQPYTTPVATRATVPTHPFAWFGLGLAGLALALSVLAGFTSGGWPLNLAYLALVAGIVMSILAILRSTKKALPIVALVLCVTGLGWAVIVTLVTAVIVAVGNAAPTVTI